MKSYEATVLFSPSLSQDEVTRKLEQMVSLVQEQGGILERQSILGSKRLPLPIQKEKQAQVALLRFLLGEEKVGLMRNQLKGEGTVLRSMITTVRARRERPTPSFRPAKKKQEVKSEEEMKAEAETIDKKLEEIFKQEDRSV